MKYTILIGVVMALIVSVGCNNRNNEPTATNGDTVSTEAKTLYLPPPYATKSSSNFSKVIGWPNDKTPVVPAGFSVTAFAKNLINPRNVYVAPNGDVLVVEANTEPESKKEEVKAELSGKAASQRMAQSANRITLLRDADKDGIPETRTVYLAGLHQPFGVLVMNNNFYVANTDGVWQYPYNPQDTVMKAQGKKIVTLPAGGYNNHWTRNIIANKDGNKILIAVGSASNVGEYGLDKEKRRANVLETNPDGSGEQVYASGLRNPVGLAIQPGTGMLYAAVNERDELGDNLVPDYLTSVQPGGFYGWPYSYFGQHEDPRLKDSMRPDLVKKAIVPDVPLGAHVAALGLTFYDGKMFPAKYSGGAFIGEHGSWNRTELVGYKVVFVPFEGGKPGKPEDFMTGFRVNEQSDEVYGRPVNLDVMNDGSLLLADDVGNTVWRVTYK